MDRRKRLATAGAISVTATAAVIALASSVGLFGLTDDSPRVGKLSPIDATRTTTSTAPDGTGTTVGTTPSSAPGAHDGADDPAGHDAGDDRVTTSGTTNTLPEVNDDHGGDDNRGPGSSHSDDDSGHGSSGSGRDHPEDD